MVHTVLHPQYKLEYFRAAKWEEVWVETALEILRTQYDLHYRKVADEGSDEAGDETIGQCMRNFVITVKIY